MSRIHLSHFPGWHPLLHTQKAQPGSLSFFTVLCSESDGYFWLLSVASIAHRCSALVRLKTPRQVMEYLCIRS
jgi:hypothetical protein